MRTLYIHFCLNSFEINKKRIVGAYVKKEVIKFKKAQTSRSSVDHKIITYIDLPLGRCMMVWLLVEPTILQAHGP